jgi:hypothetical protein
MRLIFPGDGTGTTINGPIERIASMASLVRMASGFHLQPNRKSATGMAPICRTQMDRRHHQRFGTAMDLSEGEERVGLMH